MAEEMLRLLVPKYGVNESDCKDATEWVRLIVDYVKNTQSKCLNLQGVPMELLTLTGVNFQPILDALVGSTITELYMRGAREICKVSDLARILVDTNIEKLTLHGLNVADILSLMPILKDTRITELDLSEADNRFKNVQIDEFFDHLENSRIKALKFVKSSSFPLEKLAVFSQRLRNTQLTRIDLSHGLADHVNFAAFHPMHASNLEVRAELLHAFMLSLPHTALTDLDLGWNGLGDHAAIALGGVLEDTKLEKLILCGNGISDVGVDALVPGLIRSKVTILDLGHNDIKGDNSLGHSLADTKIRELVLSFNTMRNGRIFSRPNFLQGSNVQVLKLDRLSGVRPPIREFGFSELTCLDLSSNSLQLAEISALADVLTLGHSKITHISLSGNTLSRESFYTLGECLERSDLRYIDLTATFDPTAHSATSVWGFALLLDLTKGSKIVSVYLKANRFKSNIDIIAPALANATINELDLSYNKFGNNLASLSQHLKFTAITALYLCRNSIGDEGVSILAECLADTHIVILDLSCNAITSHGAKVLAATLKKTKLRYLSLGANDIADDGVKSLAEHAANSCLTYFCAGGLAWGLRVNCVLWANRLKIQRFSDTLKQTALFTRDGNIFDFDGDFLDIDLCTFIDNHLKLYKAVSEDPFVVGAIEQDKFILDLKTQSRSEFKPTVDRNLSQMFQIIVEDCVLAYEKIMQHPLTPKETAESNKSASFFKNKALWLILEYFPIKFVSFVGEKLEANVTDHVSLLRKIEEMGLTRIVELLLLNRPLYVIDNDQEILHPYVYKLLHKYKQSICNLGIEPDGVKKITEYFAGRLDLDEAADLILLLNMGL